MYAFSCLFDKKWDAQVTRRKGQAYGKKHCIPCQRRTTNPGARHRSSCVGRAPGQRSEELSPPPFLPALKEFGAPLPCLSPLPSTCKSEPLCPAAIVFKRL